MCQVILTIFKWHVMQADHRHTKLPHAYEINATIENCCTRTKLPQLYKIITHVQNYCSCTKLSWPWRLPWLIFLHWKWRLPRLIFLHRKWHLPRLIFLHRKWRLPWLIFLHRKWRHPKTLQPVSSDPPRKIHITMVFWLTSKIHDI